METRVKAPLAANRRRALLFVLTLVLPALILLLRPLGFTLQQSVILAALVLTILWWVTGVVERTAASLFLLAAFLLCSGAPIQTVCQKILSSSPSLFCFPKEFPTAACRASCSSLFWRTLPAPPGVWCSPSSSPPRP